MDEWAGANDWGWGFFVKESGFRFGREMKGLEGCDHLFDDRIC